MVPVNTGDVVMQGGYAPLYGAPMRLEDLLQMAVSRGVEISQEALVPYVEELAGHLTEFDNRIKGLVRVGQTAENCFNFYDARLGILDAEFRKLWAELGITFVRVRSYIDTLGHSLRSEIAGQTEKFEGQAINSGEIEARLEAKNKKMQSEYRQLERSQVDLSDNLANLLGDVRIIQNTGQSNGTNYPELQASIQKSEKMGEANAKKIQELESRLGEGWCGTAAMCEGLKEILPTIQIPSVSIMKQLETPLTQWAARVGETNSAACSALKAELLEIIRENRVHFENELGRNKASSSGGMPQENLQGITETLQGVLERLESLEGSYKKKWKNRISMVCWLIWPRMWAKMLDINNWWPVWMGMKPVCEKWSRRKAYMLLPDPQGWQCRVRSGCPSRSPSWST